MSTPDSPDPGRGAATPTGPAAGPGQGADGLTALLHAAADRPAQCYLRPCGLLGPAERVAGPAYPLAGGRFRFTQAEVIVRPPDGRAGSLRLIAPVRAIAEAAALAGRALVKRIEGLLEALTAPRAAFADVSMDQPRVMGVVNVTPDSFSDGGRFFTPEAAVEQARRLVEEGAAFLDLGGESTRPGAAAVPGAEQLRRIGPVLDAPGAGVPLSVDTRDAAVMAAALDRGAVIINDVSALRADPSGLPLVAARRAPVVLMHMQGTPVTMQADPHYDEPALDVFDFLAERIAACRAAGVPPERMAVDPGIGFGKTVTHNLDLLRDAALFHGLGCCLLYGVSRKSFIGHVSRNEPAAARLPGTVAACAALWSQGVQIVRVHDVAAVVQARAVWSGIAFGWGAANDG